MKDENQKAEQSGQQDFTHEKPLPAHLEAACSRFPPVTQTMFFHRISAVHQPTSQRRQDFGPRPTFVFWRRKLPS